MPDTAAPLLFTARYYRAKCGEIEEAARALPLGQPRAQLLRVAREFEELARTAEKDGRP